MAVKPPTDPGPNLDIQRLYMWIKGVEGKVNNLLREVDLLKNDFLKKTNNLRKEFKSLNDDLLEMRREQERSLQKMDLIVKELKKTAGIEEVQVLRKYVDFWNPMNFVTQRDLDRVLQAKVTLQSQAAKEEQKT